MFRPAAAALAILSVIALASCGGGAEAPAPSPALPRELSARDLLDASTAIDTLLNAERTREAEIIARKLLEKAPADSASAARANELAARVFFTHARLPTSDLSSDERTALLSEAAACAVRSIRADDRDDAKIAFAALLASGGGLHRDAARLFDQALAVAPANAGYLMQATLSALKEGDVARARMLVVRRREAASSDAWNDALDAEIAMGSGETGAAVEWAQRAVSADRDALEFRMILARALRRDARPADAARLLSALEPGERTKPALAEQFALALAESGDLAGAAKAWDLALAANPEDPYVRAETALAHRRAGDDARAAAEIDHLKLMRGGAAEFRRIEARFNAPAPSTPAPR